MLSKVNGSGDAFAALAIAVDRPQRMPVLHFQSRQPIRDAEGNEAWIEIYSSDSDIARHHTREGQRKRINMRGRGRLTPEDLEAEATDLLASLTCGWYLVGLDGNPMDVPFSKDNARKLYDTTTWIREQVDEFAADRGNFTPASLPTLSSGPKASSGRAEKP